MRSIKTLLQISFSKKKKKKKKKKKTSAGVYFLIKLNFRENATARLVLYIPLFHAIYRAKGLKSSIYPAQNSVLQAFFVKGINKGTPP